MLKSKYFLLLSSVLLTASLQADMEEAKELFNEAKCMECHNKGDFKANDAKVNSFEKLHKSVSACSFNSNTGWFDDETEDVSRYLNERHYKFKAPPKEEE